MKKFQILMLISIAFAISILISFMGSLSHYESIQSAKTNPGKFLNIIASLDPSKPIIYDPLNDPNFLSFSIIDSLGETIKVVYRNAKPDNLETSERLVLKGAVKDGYFDCKEILMKCPSKYKEEMQSAEKNLSQTKNQNSLNQLRLKNI